MTDPAPRPTVVVFDLGGVLVDWNPRHLYRKIFDDPQRLEWFLGTICTHTWHEQVDGGALPEQIVPPLQARHPEWAEQIAAFHDRFAEMFGDPHREMVAALGRLHAAGTPLYALTNWGADTFPWARQQYPFLGQFRDIVVSGEERLLKPDPRIFRVLFQRGGFQPGQAVFIDDNQANVVAARGLGMFAVHHVAPGSTLEALRALGLPA